LIDITIVNKFFTVKLIKTCTSQKYIRQIETFKKLHIVSRKVKLLAAIDIRVAKKGDMEFAKLGKSLNFLKVNRESLYSSHETFAKILALNRRCRS